MLAVVLVDEFFSVDMSLRHNLEKLQNSENQERTQRCQIIDTMVTLKDRFKQLNELKQLTANQPQFVPPQAEESSQSSSEHIEDDDALLDDVDGDKNKYEHAEDAIPESEAAGEPKDEEVVSQYRKMIKMGMSAGAVEQKMRNDGVHQSIIDAVFAVEEPLNEGVSDHPVEDGNEGMIRSVIQFMTRDKL